jgi:hypothetical protein
MTEPKQSKDQEQTILGQSLGGDDDNSPAGQNDPNPQSVDKQIEGQEYLSQFVGEGKKYKSVEDLAKAYANADKFIETMKIENKAAQHELEELRKKAEKAQEVDQIVAMLRGKQSADEESDDGDTFTKEKSPQQKTAPSEEEIAKVVARLMEQKENEKKTLEQKRQIEENQKKAWEILSKSEEEGGYGSIEAAKRAVREAIEANPARKEIINQLGSYDPETLAPFLRTLTPSKGKEYIPGDDSKLSISQPTSFDGQLTWSKAKRIKKENPRLYKSVKFQQQMHQAAAKLGDDFFKN